MTTIVSEFKKNVEIFGDNVAIKEGNRKLTYKELDFESNKVAYLLSKKGLEKGQFVSIFLKRSIETVVSILGILKVGGVYVPLDPTHPTERTKYIIEDTNSPFVLTNRSLEDKINELEIYDKCIFLEELSESKNIDVEITSDDLAYIIYTSGTTGNPKGTLIRHVGVVNIVDWQKENWEITSDDVILQFATYSFDASILDTFASLFSGSTLYLLEDEERMSEEHFLNALEREKITLVPILPTVFFNQLVSHVNESRLQSFNNVRLIGVGGELLTGELARKFKKGVGKDIRFFNLYGPTEITVMAAGYEVPNDLGEEVFSVPIGKDLKGTKLYIVNENNELCTDEEEGELWIASVGISVGYLNQEEKTKEVFIDNPFEDIYGGTIYKSGDIVKRLNDGNIEFVGRKDTQVKIRGHRIEVAEIENRMSQIDGVKDAVVVVESNHEQKLLKGFYTTTKEVNVGLIIDVLKEKLPNYMIPSKMKEIEVIPYTPTGKADRKKLEGMEADSINLVNADEIVEPRNKVEEDILLAWKKVLNIDGIGIKEDFFEIGGHSLKIIAVLSELKKTYRDLSIKDFFDLRTVENLALKVSKSNSNNQEEEKFEFTKLAEYPFMSVESEIPDIKNALVTGATGFLGIHVVKKLVDNGINVYVLVRGDNPEVRMNEKYKYYFGTELSPRISVIKGDLTEKSLGLSKEKFNELAFSIDAVIHSAADVRHFGDRKHFEKINVEGTQNVLDLLDVNDKLVFHHISTVGIIEDLLSENKWDQFKNLNSFNNNLSLESVYTDTKMMAENLVLNKINEGKHVFVYRMGNLIGRYSDGKFQDNIDNNAFYRMIKLMYLVGKAPDVKWMVDFMPIDFASDVIFESIIEKNHNQRIYHVSHPEPMRYKNFINLLNEIGIKIDLLEKDNYEEFLMTEDISEEARNLAVSQLDGDGANDTKAIFDSNKTMNVLKIENVPVIDKNYLNKMINHAKDVGYMDDLKVKA